MHGILSGIKRQTLKIREKLKTSTRMRQLGTHTVRIFEKLLSYSARTFRRLFKKKKIRAQNYITKLHRGVTESLKATTLFFIFNFFKPNQAVKNKKSYPLRHMHFFDGRVINRSEKFAACIALKPPIFGKAKFFAWYIIRVFS